MNDGDVPLLVATDDLSGSTLVVTETIKGVGLSLNVLFDAVEEGQFYSARVAAVNSVGRGAWAEAPSPRRARSVPEAPVATVSALSQTEMAVSFTEPDSGGDDIDLYKVEWAASSEFGTGKVVKIRISK